MKVIGIIIALLLIAIGLGLFLGSESSDYEVVVERDVTELEQELANMDAAVAAGDLSPEDAAVARASIIAKLDTIDTNMEAAGNAKLTSAQKAQVASALTRLKNILIRFSDTLVSVDVIASQHAGSSSDSKSLSSTFLEVVANGEYVVVAADIDMETDTSVEASLDEIEDTVAETVAEVVAEAAEMLTEVASTTEEILIEGEGELDAVIDGSDTTVELEAESTAEATTTVQ